MQDKKALIYGGGLLAVVAVGGSVAHSFHADGAVCTDPRQMCAPLSPHMSDLGGERQPNPTDGKPPLTVAVSTATASFVDGPHPFITMAMKL